MEGKQAVVTLVFKKGDRQNTSICRAIYALPIYINNFEKLIHDQLYNHVNNRFSAFYFLHLLVSTIRNTQFLYFYLLETLHENQST